MNTNGIDTTVEPGSILEELLKTPMVHQMLLNTIEEINPQNGPKLVRNLLWTNLGIPLALLDAVPPIANYLMAAVRELLVQVGEKFPSTILLSLAKSMADDFDTTPLRETKAAVAQIIQGLMQAKDVDVPAAIGKGITNLARSVNTLNAEDPDFIPSLTATIIENIDSKEFSQMVNTILNAVLNQHPPLGSWARNLVAVRVKERFHIWRNKGGKAMSFHGPEKFQGT